MNGYVEVTAEEADALKAMGIRIYFNWTYIGGMTRHQSSLYPISTSEELSCRNWEDGYKFYIKAEQTGS